MRKRLIFLLLLTMNQTWAQNTLSDGAREQINSTALRPPANAMIWGVESSNKGGLIGTIYLDTAWARGNLKLFDSIQVVGGQPVDTLSGLAMRYDVHSNEIEILQDTYKDIKALKGEKVSAFSLEENGKPVSFINAKTLEVQKPLEGFFEILAPGKLTLAALHKTSVRKPNYNAAFETGSKDTKITIQQDYYVLQKGKAEKIKQNKKGILDLMKDKSEEIEAFLKVNDPDLKDRSNLTTLFERYNRL